MTDYELMKMAAKSAGYQLDGPARRYLGPTVSVESLLILNERGGHTVWNPLTDDGDALRLAVKLNIALLFPIPGATHPLVGAGQVGSMDAAKMEPVSPDKDAAARRAIVRAAAAVG